MTAVSHSDSFLGNHKVVARSRSAGVEFRVRSSFSFQPVYSLILHYYITMIGVRACVIHT